MPTTSYYLSQDVHMCLADDQVVILDLMRDRYLSLDSDASIMLRPYLDLLAGREGLPEDRDEPRLREVLAKLSADGLVCTSPLPSMAVETHRPGRRAENAITPRPPSGQNLCAHYALHYIWSVVRARVALRTCSLHRIVVSERIKRSAQPGAPREFDADETARLCSIYCRLRVIATDRGQCLFDTLALKLFLGNYGIFPDWIFGVRLNPFGAHCWLQHGNTVVNDSIDSVRPFTPIMTA